MNLLMLSSLMTLGGSGVSYMFFPQILGFALSRAINLSPGGLVWPMWSKPPFRSNSSYYIYTVENPREALAGSKARMGLKGPFTYEVVQAKVDSEFSDDETRVKFINTRKFFYSATKSAPGFDERITVTNPVIPTVQSIVVDILGRIPFARVASPVVFSAVNAFLDQHNERLFMRRTPRELLSGFRLGLFDTIESLAARFGLSALVPPGPPDNTFGIVYVQNKTEDPFELYTGVGSSRDRIGQVISWRNQNKLTVWKGDKCNAIRGTNGEIYKPGLDKTVPITIFLGQACRTLTLDPLGDTPTTYGYSAVAFEISDASFQGGRSNPDNECFCRNKQSPDCLYDGLMRIEPCFFGSPLYLSRAHMKYADRRIRSTVDGMDQIETPDAAQFYLDPSSATILEAELALTNVIRVERQPVLRDMDSIRNISFIPFVFVYEKVIVPPAVAMPLIILQGIVANSSTASIGGVAIGTAGVVLATLRGRRSSAKVDVEESESSKKEDTEDSTKPIEKPEEVLPTEESTPNRLANGNINRADAE